MQNIKSILLTNTGLTLIGKIVVSLFIVLAIFVLTKVFSAVLHRLAKKQNFQIHVAKTKTIIRVLSNIWKVLVYFWGLMLILDTFGINTNSILATAGIGGVAIGFGAQSLVKDVISGGFLIFEDQFALGDYVKIDSMEGYVIETGLRLTKLKSFTGEIHMIPNGNITAVTNISRSPMRALIEVKVPDRVDVEDALVELTEALTAFAKEVDYFTEPPKVMGLTGNLEFSSILTIVGYTQPMRQWEAERAMRLIAYRVLAKPKKKEEHDGGTSSI